MDKKRITLSILIIFILIVSMTPFKMDSIQTDFNKRPSNFTQSTFSEELKDINPLSPIIDNTWNEAENSTINNKFEIKDKSNETTKEFSLENCEDWTLKNNFNFTNIRSEKIINGDAEISDELWTDFLPPQYAGSVSRENNIPNGDVINGEYSWYFNLSTNDYAVIIGFDELFNVSSDSVVFSFSYSLLRNNLGMSYDSNICIRLFFQFDIYIFFWFNGNIGVLSNVTGPGGYADLLVNDASFDGLNHKYSLNITDLGLELFNQKPDQLRSLAVQTWGELPSYEMEFLIDDLSLTDQKDPTSIDLSVNTNSVIGDIGNGFVSFIEPPNSKINYDIDYITQEKILFDFDYELIGTSKIESSRICFFEDWETIEWNESTSIILNRPENVTELKITKSVPIEWTINQICVDGLPQAYEINDFNGTHKNIEFIITSYNNIEFIFYSTNLINNIILSDYQITHNDILIANIESEINNDEISIYILNQNGDVYYKSTNHTNEYGEALITDIQLNSETPRGILSFVAFFNNNDDIGIGKKDFEITTFPTFINPTQTKIKTNYKQDFIVEINFMNMETMEIIDFASVEYIWLFGSDILHQNINELYSVEVDNTEAIPGNYLLFITGSKDGYATANVIIEIEIVFTDYNITLYVPDNALPGDFLILYSQVIDNFSLPVFNIEVRFEVNNELLSDTWTNLTGYAKITYQISPIYQLDNLNVSCSIVINEIPLIQVEKTIKIEISEIPQEAQINSLVQNFLKETNETLFFNFTIIYPSFGKNWYISIPTGFNPIAVSIITETDVILAEIVDNIIVWRREINTTISTNDILEIETLRPQITTIPESKNNEISITITVHTNYIPYKNLKIQITRNQDWQVFNQWNLYLNEELVTEKHGLLVTSDYIIFQLNNTQQAAYLVFQLIGTKSSLIQISTSTVILGTGTLILTICSIILLLKKKSDISLDIQV